MNLVGDYGSSDEENDDSSPETSVPVKPLPFTVPSSSSGAAVRPRTTTSPLSGIKKALKMPYLPPEILEALTKEAASDSDDDVPVVQSKPKAKKPVADDSCKLLGMLPAPKQRDSGDIFASSSRPSSCVTSSADSIAEPKKSSFNFSYTSTETSSAGSKSTISKGPLLGAAASVAKPKPAPVRIVAEDLKFDTKPPIPSMPKVNSNFSGPVPSVSSSGSSSSSSSSSYEIPQAPTSQPEQPSYEPEPYDAPNAYSNKKKRERDLEHQLMSGDLSGIDNANLTSARGVVSWDASKYIDQQRQEYNIMKEYTGGSGFQPTKTQNKRHQLSALAVRAAETEIAMLDAKGARLATKRETQAKYGW